MTYNMQILQYSKLSFQMMIICVIVVTNCFHALNGPYKMNKASLAPYLKTWRKDY